MRYDRQMILPEIGEEGQLKLKKAKYSSWVWEGWALPLPSIWQEQA